jgi:predicted ArsR family transcriptional regulator
MTSLLQQAIAEIEKLSAEGQDAIAARIMAELADERAWAGRFSATSDEQWERLTQAVRREIAAGETTPLDDVFPPGVSQP